MKDVLGPGSGGQLAFPEGKEPTQEEQQGLSRHRLGREVTKGPLGTLALT